MGTRGSTVRWLVPAVAMGVVLGGSVGKASADLESTNGCAGSGTFEKGGFTVDAATVGNDVVTIPKTDTVDWKGSVSAPPGAYSGNIALDLPAPFGTLQIDSWGGNSQSTGNAGSRHYDLTSWVPAGVEFKVFGEHTDENGYCKGYVRLKVDGGPFDGPVAPISLAATLGTGLGLFGVLRPLFRRALP
jgi:hypothetical protein